MRPVEKCAHGVPFFGTPYPVCRECDLIWERSCLALALAAVDRHRNRIAAWSAAPKEGDDEPGCDRCGEYLEACVCDDPAFQGPEGLKP